MSNVFEAGVASLSPDYLLPIAFGHEHETSHLIGQPGDMQEMAAMVNNIDSYLEQGLRGKSFFLLNGFKIYPGRHGSIVEVATPECATPDELLTYVRAGEQLWDTILTNFGIELSRLNPDKEIHVRSQDRVVDYRGNRKASHLSLGINDNETYPVDIPTILGHQITRQFVNGSGYARSRGWHYAQKIGGLSKINDYGYFGSMYRWSGQEGTQRFEDRCGDHNISDWAMWQRAGSFALAVAISRTPLKSQLPDIRALGPTLQTAKCLNRLPITRHGKVVPLRSDGYVSVDFQQKLAELSIDKLWLYMDEMPEIYFDVARALYAYCEDYRSVLEGKEEYNILKDRVDWASKLGVVDGNIQRNKDNYDNSSANYKDKDAVARDIHFDFKGRVFKDGQLVRRHIGSGHRQKERGNLYKRVRSHEVEYATKHAPRSTRAGLRTDILRSYPVKSCDWAQLTLDTQDGEETRVTLLDVRMTELGRQQSVILDRYSKG